jgi:hypothetical protein
MLLALEVLQLPIDNDVYNRMGEGWWEEENPLNVLRGSITPGRFGYFREVLTNRLGLTPGINVPSTSAAEAASWPKNSRASDARWSGWILLAAKLPS